MSRATLLAIIAVFLVFGLMLFRLSSLTPGLSVPEIATYESAGSLQAINENLVHAPYKLAVFISTRVFDSAFGMRLVGAAVGGLSIVLFFLLARKLFYTSVAVTTTALYAGSSLLLHNARLATPNVMLLGLLGLLAAGYYLRFGKRKDLGWALCAVVVAVSLYTPGMIFFVTAAILWQFRHARKSFEELKTPTIAVVSVIFGLLLVPLIVSLVREPELWRAYAGLPAVFEPVSIMIKYAGTAIISLFVMSPYDPIHWLGRQPVLDIFGTAMFAYGAWKLVRQYKLDRLWTLGGILLLAVIWIGVTTNRQALLILLPFVYLVIGIGIQNFMNRWLKVFPRNPIARAVGSTLLLAAICLSVNFQVYRYFVAWPHADATKAVFTEKFPE